MFNYNDTKSAFAIKPLTQNNLSLCVDCFSEQSSYEFCAQVLSKGATYAALRPIDSIRPDLDFRVCMGVLYFDAPFALAGQKYDAPPGAFESAVRFAEVAERLLAEDKIKPHPNDVRMNGLEGVLDGIHELKEGKVHGVKLVYTLSQ